MARQIDGGGTAEEGIGGAGFVPDASGSIKGIIMLAGDLGGTADDPTVPGLADKAPKTTVDQLFTVPEKALVDGSTSAGVVSTLVKRDSAGKFTTVEIFVSGTPSAATSLVPKSYVDTAVASVTAGSIQTFVKTAAYTFVLSDANDVLEYNSGSAGTFTVPLDSAVNFPIGTFIECCQVGSGKLTLAATAGVTLRTASSLVSRTQYSSISLRKRAVNDWVVSGDLA